jgi:hypothetical protein
MALSVSEVNETADEDEAADVREFWTRLGLPGLVDVHTHFMPEQVLKKVWAYFDAAGPLTGMEWPITYRHEEERRVALLRDFGVRIRTPISCGCSNGSGSGTAGCGRSATTTERGSSTCPPLPPPPSASPALPSPFSGNSQGRARTLSGRGRRVRA